MIQYERYILDNGLTVILHPDESTPLVAVNVLYKVGSRNENPEKTGFAHLFEHLMFGGSENIRDFDTAIQNAGGENNAFTNSDLTNFYNIVPADNIETALWLESDRMKQLDFNQKSLDVQKKVVVEEFKETCLNKPYGDLWHELSGLAYKDHPYQWPTIGKVPAHIEDASLADVESFFYKYYRPSNAVLVISGKYNAEAVKERIHHWFGDIPKGSSVESNLTAEKEQTEKRTKTVYRKIPSDAHYLAFHIPRRAHPDFAAYDIMSDVLSGGRSSRFYQNLLKGTSLFSNISAYITGTIDPGLFIVDARFLENADMDKAIGLIWKELDRLKTEKVDQEELQKIKNGMISSICFSEVSIVHKAINLAYYEMLGDAEIINRQESQYNRVTSDDIIRVAQQTFKEENCSEVYYLKEMADKLS